MSFLTPLFLLGGLAVALPIIFHLIRRTTREKVPFSSLMFLLPTPPRVTRRSRLENLWLLLLRCLVLCLLAVGFARPFFQSNSPVADTANAPRRVALLVDTSASMRRVDLWDRARDKVEKILAELTPADQAALFAFDGQLHPLVGFDEWARQPIEGRRALALGRLDNAKPGWGGTDLGHALLGATERMEEAATREKQGTRGLHKLIVVSDFAQGTRLTGLQGFEWPKGYRIVFEPLPVRPSVNAGVHPVVDAAEADQAAPDSLFRVRVSNASDSKRDQFQLRWIGSANTSTGDLISVYVPPGESRVAKIAFPSSGERNGRVELSGDDHTFDNLAYVAGGQPELSSVVYLGADLESEPSGPLYYLKRALQKTRRQNIQIIAAAPTAPLTPEVLAAASLMVVTTNLTVSSLQAASAFMDSGKVVVIVVSDPAIATTLAALAGVSAVRITPGAAGAYAMLSAIDFEHPLFAPFADPRYSDFTKIHFWKYRRVEAADLPGARVVAAFDNGDPALIDFPAKRGSLLIFSSGWQPADSQLALSSKFVPLVYAILERSGGLPAPHLQYAVGDDIPLPGGPEAARGVIRKPDGGTLALTNGASFAGTDIPGIYSLHNPQTTQSFAVNIPSEETRTAPMDLEELTRLGLPLQLDQGRSASDDQRERHHLQAVELESRQKIWRWLIAGSVVFLLVETWLGGRVTKGGSTQSETDLEPGPVPS